MAIREQARGWDREWPPGARRPRPYAMTLATFTEYLDDQNRIYPLTSQLDEEGFDVDGMSEAERERHEEERLERFEFTLKRYAAWCLHG